jgi:predicted RNA-binding Zn-ribbon protein involved in translation (DUF1610 family)
MKKTGEKPRKKAFLPLCSVPSQMECPRCGRKLRLLGVGVAVPQNYICLKCGYRGPLGLEPGRIRIGKDLRL